MKTLAAVLIASVLMGLSPIAHAQSTPYNWKPVVIDGGGFVDGIVTNPSQQNLMFCRTDIGGAYKWDNANNQWDPLLDAYTGYANGDNAFNGVESIATDPVNPNRLYIACGYNGYYGPNAFLISTDQGATFTVVSTQIWMYSNDDGRGNGERLAVDPNQDSTLFFASRWQGLWESTNYGSTWSPVASFPVHSTSDGVGLNFVQFVASSGASGTATPIIYVGVSQPGSAGGNLYRSTDGGVTWNAVATGAPSNLMPHRAAQDGLGNMYVTFGDGPGPNNVNSGYVSKLSNISAPTPSFANVTPPTGEGGFSGVSVSKQNPSEVIVSTIDRWYPGDVIYESLNGGSSWTDTLTGNVADCTAVPWMAWHNPTLVWNPPPRLAWWIQSAEIDPFNSSRVFHGSGDGVFETTNLGTTGGVVWSPEASAGIEEMVLMPGGLSIAAPPTGPLLLDALGDISGFTHYDLDTTPPDSDFYTPLGSNNTSVDYAELQPSHMVRAYNGQAGYGAYSTDSGADWTTFPSYPATANNNEGLSGIISISANDTSMVWTPGIDNQYYSTDHGNTWTPSKNGTTDSNGYPAISDRAADGVFYIYDAGTGAFLVSVDGGKDFTIANAGSLPANGNYPPAAVFGNPGDVWLPTYAGLYHSTNYGASWAQVLTQDVQDVGFGMPAPGASYPAIYIFGQVNGTYGVYQSIDEGNTWTQINDAAHQWGQITAVIGDKRTYGLCYVGTGGRGIQYGTPVPVYLTTLSPSIAGAGNPGFTLTVSGVGFTSPMTVDWNGTSLPTTFVASTTLQAQISAADVVSVGTAAITVAGGPDGPTNPLTLTIAAPPAITGFTPSSVVAGSPTITLLVSGTGFTPGAVINWNGAAFTTQFLYGTLLQTVIPASDLIAPASVPVTVSNSSDDTSPAVDFEIVSNGIPTISSLSPASALTGSAAVNLTVTGTGYDASSVVNWNGTALTTGFTSATQLTAVIPATDLTAVTTGEITVSNINGKTSSPASFSVLAFVSPTITSILPTSATVGAAAFTLTVNGANFNSGTATIEWNGTALTPTTYVSAAQLTATVPASDLTSSGTAEVLVSDSRGALSNALPFTIGAGGGGVVHTFSAGLQLFSTPTDYSGQSLDSIFDVSGVTLAVWSPTQLFYAVTPTAPADAIAQGEGYWSRFAQSTDLIQPGTDLGAGQSQFNIPLSSGWNMVGDPTAHSVLLSTIGINDGAGHVTPFSSSNLVSPTIYEYSPASNTYVISTELDPWMGCWVFANAPCTMQVPEP